METLKAHFPVLGENKFKEVTLENAKLRSSFWLKLTQSVLGSSLKSYILSAVVDAYHFVLTSNAEKSKEGLQSLDALVLGRLVLLKIGL